jgi:hypothetical protein
MAATRIERRVMGMTIISSGRTTYYKKVFPAISFGFLAVFVAAAALDGALREEPIFLIGPLAMGIFGFVLMKLLVWDLVDEVYDCGDYLIVKNRGEEDKIFLSNIMNVSASTLTNPPRITLRLVQPSKFGTEIAFSPVSKRTLNPFARNQVAEDLMVRIDRARRAL